MYDDYGRALGTILAADPEELREAALAIGTSTSEVENAMADLSASFASFELTLRMEVLPPMQAFAHEMHAWWFDTAPWYRRWWHTVTGHRHGLREFVEPDDAE